MLNDKAEYERAGTLVAIARSNGDELAAQSWSDWVRRAIELERGEDKKTARMYFDYGYKRAAETNQRFRNLSARW